MGQARPLICMLCCPHWTDQDTEAELDCSGSQSGAKEPDLDQEIWCLTYTLL